MNPSPPADGLINELFLFTLHPTPGFVSIIQKRWAVSTTFNGQWTVTSFADVTVPEYCAYCARKAV